MFLLNIGTSDPVNSFSLTCSNCFGRFFAYHLSSSLRIRLCIYLALIINSWNFSHTFYSKVQASVNIHSISGLRIHTNNFTVLMFGNEHMCFPFLSRHIHNDSWTISALYHTTQSIASVDTHLKRRYSKNRFKISEFHWGGSLGLNRLFKYYV